MTKAFFDTNVLVYSLGSDAKAARAQSLLADGGIISVQSLMNWPTLRGGSCGTNGRRSTLP
ncbi:MAG: hypothetical protein PGN21_01760 [Sphingomonas paucimobilis]